MSTSVVYATPYRPPTAPGTRWPGLTMTWEGWDGSRWTLTDDSGGVYLPNGGVRGLLSPEHEYYTSSAPSVAGERLLGSRALTRSVFWPIEVYTDAGSQEWLDLNRRFRRTLDPERPGVWTVTQPGGTDVDAGKQATDRTRSLVCHYVPDPNQAFDIDPSVRGWAVYGVELRAFRPYWQGKRITRGPWVQSGGQDFIDPVNGAPGFYVSDDNLSASASIPNPGDVEQWLTWEISGTTSVTVGVGGFVTEVPFAVDETETLVLDTDNQVATLYQNGPDGKPTGAGEDVTDDLGEFDAVPVPPGADVALDVTFLGESGGSVSASLVPLYREAF